jgi:glutathione S-transferase
MRVAPASDETRAVPELLHFGVSHYNEKVRWALDLKRVPHRRRELAAGFHVPRARLLTGQNKLPILILDGRALHDSTSILDEVERRWPDPALYPADPAERARALDIEDYFDEQVAPDVRCLFWSTYMDDTAACSRMAVGRFGVMTRVLWTGLFPVMRPAFRRNMGVLRPKVEAARARLGGRDGQDGGPLPGGCGERGLSLLNVRAHTELPCLRHLDARIHRLYWNSHTLASRATRDCPKWLT